MAAINKRKLLASAQRQIQKGALDKALKDYQSILDADPRDTNVRLKLGDLQLRRDCAEEAIAAYLKVADQFMRDGFDAKAVALYKQITKIDPQRYDIYLPLADLYQRLGLVSEAMSSLQTAADAYHRQGRKRDALDLLRRMAQLDPSNTTSRLKVADLLVQEGLNEEALAEYEGASAELDTQGDWEGRVNVLQRILEIAPSHVEALESLARIFLENDRATEAEPLARQLADADESRPEFHALLADTLLALGRTEDANESFRKQAAVYRERGDDDRARDIMQRHFTSEMSIGDSGEAPAAPAESDASPFGSEGLGDSDGDSDVPELELSAMDALPPEAPAEQKVAEDGPTVSVSADPAPSVADTTTPPIAATETAPTPATPVADAEADTDVEQLLAEAAVYVRYGKHDRALATLDRLLAAEPDNPHALEKLGDVRLASGDAEQAVEAWVRGAKAAANAGDAALFETLRLRIEPHDSGAAAETAALMSVVEEETQVAVADGAPDDETPADETAAAASAAESSVDTPADEEDASGGFDDIEIEIDDGLLGAFEDASDSLGSEPDEEAPGLDAADTPEPTVEESDANADDSDANADDSDANADEFEPSADELAASAEEATASDATPADASGVSADTASSVQGELEEADFYFEQDMFEEARASYERVLALAPGHPGAQLRLGEIAAALGEDPGATGSASAASAEPASATAEPDETPEIEDTPELFESAGDAFSAPDEMAAPDEEVASATSEVEVDLSPAPEPSAAGAVAVEAPAGEAAEAPAGEAAEAPADEDEAVPADSGVADEPVAAADDQAPVLTGGDVFRVSSPQDDSFDLAAELSDALKSEAPAAAEAQSSTDGDGFDSIFREFKRGVSEALTEGDVQTHFDLGIAYREMGLLDDAITEFSHVLRSDERRMDGLHMMAVCALEVGRPADAVGHLEQALSGPDVPAEQEAALRFDLGRAQQAAGDVARALESMRRVAELKPGFQDVDERIAELEAGDGAAAADAGEESYECFDELIDGADETDAADATSDEGYVGFDDLIAEVESEDAAEAAAAEAERTSEAATGEPEAAEPEADPEAKPAKKGGRRRRKVSFV